MTKKQKKSLQQILIALALVILLKLLLRVLPALPTPVELLLYLIPYLVVGKDVLRKAIKGVKNRQPFDECFLMAVATVARRKRQDVHRLHVDDSLSQNRQSHPRKSYPYRPVQNVLPCRLWHP